MATFKVGQRVRVIGVRPHVIDRSGGRIIGREGVIQRRLDHRWIVLVPGVAGVPTQNCRSEEWICYPEDLAPLTDPRADAFIESIKKLAREPRIPVMTPAFGD